MKPYFRMTPLPYKQKSQQPSASGPSRRRTRPTLTPSLTHLQAPQPRHSPSPSTSRPSSVRPPSSSHSPHPSRPSTPPPQTQLASLRGALEASRTREEASKRDLERYGKELEMMRWERDALRAQVCQMQAYLGALLASPPPFTPYAMSPNPGSPSPMGVAGWYPPLHMQVPYGGASPGSSPASRGRRRTRPDTGMAAEDEDDSQVSEVLADAILKRPNAMLGHRSTPQSPMGHSRPDSNVPRSAGHSPARDSDELLEELTFPSLYPRQPS
ncbi:hypothetical protein CPB85DRAFT_921145 [Mucidula mucida]|nr:hypothetical protein CPB85DRAFT_921145 [Mucidula mucida]